MKRFMGLVTCALLLLVMPAYAQQPGTANDPHHLETPATGAVPPAAPSTPPSKNADMPMMDMCRQMMTGGMMGGAMMGGPASMDPKDRADMLQMRGEMMKAMGDIMMTHARRMQGTTAK